MIGTCNMNLDRWYYDSITRTCQRFKYGGNNHHIIEIEKQIFDLESICI